ncbi:MAG: xanthine dehydrogenase accessory protein XdhC [Xanthomonadales bacterium]|nr:xanthine dehydrogenase accessory protein XdhC [Xanthomonadales bacterium]
MNDWIADLYTLADKGHAAVLLTVIETRGSAPRGSGARMIVTGDTCRGSVGGGQLEHQCTAVATQMLDRHEPARLQKFVLGAALDQCCGGAVEVLFEPIRGDVPAWLKTLYETDLQRQGAVLATELNNQPRKTLIHAGSHDSPLPESVVQAARAMLSGSEKTHRVEDVLLENIRSPELNIAVFGAGHVGTALVGILAGIDAEIRWIDDREDIFRQVPDGVRTIHAPSPAVEAANMPPGSYYLVMTHSHQLDLGICLTILARNDAAYCGLIGSASKRKRFEKRFLEHGLEQAQVDQLVCPIGIAGIGGKLPGEIAIATAAEILQVSEKRKQEAMT